MRKVRWFGPLGLVVGLLLVVACAPVSEPILLDNELRVMGQVDAKGGTLCSQQGACLDFPAGAVDTTTTIRGRIAESTSSDADMVGAVYEFQGDTEQFKKAISLVLPVPADVAKDEIDELEVVFFKDGAWVAVATQSNHDSTRRIGTTDHLSRWGLRRRKCRTPRPEVCDGRDNDCDGKTDEGAICRTGQVCKLGKCVPQCSCQSDADCSAGSICANCQCQSLCAPGQAACSGQCVDLMSDAANCGACGKRCAPSSICTQGVCSGGSSCSRGQTRCGGTCVDVSTDSKNCGACGNVCQAGQSCAQGTCFGNPCGSGKTVCAGQCVDVTTDRNNCGACGKVCAQGDSCVQGRCQGNNQCQGVQCPPGQSCVNGRCQAPCTPAPEVCDGKDNDCDGQIDEGLQCPCRAGATRACYTGPSSTRNKGACKDGRQTCSGQTWGACVGQVLPTKETCDGVDNDCDGQADEDFPQKGSSCVVPGQKGDCAIGKYLCGANGSQLVCVSVNASTQEVCGDGKDNDCDGQIDNGPACICTPGQTQACYTGPSSVRKIGECRDGIQTCDPQQKWGACVGSVLPVAEVCGDGKDNDCDGQIDECLCPPGATRVCYAGPSSTRNKGACKDGVQTCGPQGWGSCVGSVLPTRETCDNKDNDCDGAVDEGACGTQCNPAQTMCQGACVDLSSDPKNCGACGQACAAGATCSQGACVGGSSCSSGQIQCSGMCVNPNTDTSHCGGCNKACASGQTCSQGVCVISCPSGMHLCGGQCVDLNTNMNHCGACGNRCIQNKMCTQGICQ